MAAPFVHPSAEVDEAAELGVDAQVWHHVHVMAGARIGERVVLGHAVFVGRDVRIGAGCRIQNHVSVFEGVELEEEVFVGPSAVFTNVEHPRAAISQRGRFSRTLVRRGATIGANATILPGVTLGSFSFVAAGAVVTADVADHALVQGTPARQVGHVSRAGRRLAFDYNGQARCEEGGDRYQLRGGVVEWLGPA